MIWSIDDIERTLLGQKASVLALPPDLIVDSVNRVEQTLGPDWIRSEQTATGIAPALGIIGMGLRLPVLDGLANTEKLINSLRRRDQNAEAELTAIYLIRDHDSSVELELEPPIGTRKADFRVRSAGESEWTTVEVTQATTSESEKHLRDVILKILEALKKSQPQFSLDIIFYREPTDTEIAALRSELPHFSSLPGQQQMTLRDGLGVAVLNNTPISEGRRIEIPGLGPTIGIIMFVGGGRMVGLVTKSRFRSHFRTSEPKKCSKLRRDNFLNTVWAW